MDVSLDLATLLVLGGDEPLTRRAELLDQANVPKDEAGLGGEVADELLLGRAHRVAGGHDH